MHLPPILGEPPNWRFGELASLKIAMICLGIIFALGMQKANPSFWANYYWLVWLIFLISMLAPTTKWLSYITTAQPHQRQAASPKRTSKKMR